MKRKSGQTGPSTETIADLVLAALVESAPATSRLLAKKNVSLAQLLLLAYLADGKQVIMTDIAKRNGNSTAAATGAIDRLEKLGYAERSRPAEDRRKVLVSVTRAGLELVASFRDTMLGAIPAASATDAKSAARVAAAVRALQLQTLKPAA